MTKMAVIMLVITPSSSVVAKPCTEPGAIEQQHHGGDDGGHVGVEHGAHGVFEADAHSVNHRAAQADLLLHALEDDHVGVHRHADAQNETRDAGQQ